MRHSFEMDGRTHHLWLAVADSAWLLSTDHGSARVALERRDAPDCVLTIDGQTHMAAAVVDGDAVHIHLDGNSYTLRYRDPIDLHAADGETASHDVARAPMPGAVLAVQVAAGASVVAGETLLTIESMKLETAIRAGRDGTVETVHVAAGQSFDRDAPLVTLRRTES